MNTNALFKFQQTEESAAEISTFVLLNQHAS